MTDRDYSPSESEQKRLDKEEKREKANRKKNMEWLVETHGVAHVLGLMLDEDEAYHLNNEANDSHSRFKSIYK